MVTLLVAAGVVVWLVVLGRASAGLVGATLAVVAALLLMAWAVVSTPVVLITTLLVNNVHRPSR